jgi:hypothetical protein
MALQARKTEYGKFEERGFYGSFHQANIQVYRNRLWIKKGIFSERKIPNRINLLGICC